MSLDRPQDSTTTGLNESPSEKEGKYARILLMWLTSTASLNESPSEKEGKSSIKRRWGAVQLLSPQ